MLPGKFEARRVHRTAPGKSHISKVGPPLRTGKGEIIERERKLKRKAEGRG